MTGVLTFIISIVIGYFLFLYLSHPEKKKDKLPKISIGNLDLSPNIRVHIGSKTYWFHHWFLLSLLIGIPIIVQEDFQMPMIIKGVIVGGILQGLRYPDRFKFRYPRLKETIKNIEDQTSKTIKNFEDKTNKRIEEFEKRIKEVTSPPRKKRK